MPCAHQSEIVAHAYYLQTCKLWLNEKKNEAEISTRAFPLESPSKKQIKKSYVQKTPVDRLYVCYISVFLEIKTHTDATRVIKCMLMKHSLISEVQQLS